MKKIISAVLLALVLFATVFSSAMAKETVMVTITVRNKTGEVATLSLKGDEGHAGVSIADGMTQFTVPAGKYDYYASSVCGNTAGKVNLLKNRSYIFSCPGEGSGLSVIPVEPPAVACVGGYEYWHWFTEGDPSHGHWHPGVIEDYGGVQGGDNGWWELRCTNGEVILD